MLFSFILINCFLHFFVSGKKYCTHQKSNRRILVTGEKYINDNCKLCQCQLDGSIKCDEISCSKLTCEKTIIPKNSCCPICWDVCENQKNFTQLQSAVCEKCQCIKKKIICHKIHCQKPQCNDWEISSDTCCPVCFPAKIRTKRSHLTPFYDSSEQFGDEDCFFAPENRYIINGNRFVISSCETCVCRFGELNCERPKCPSINCPLYLQITDDCCSRCRQEEFEPLNSIPDFRRSRCHLTTCIKRRNCLREITLPNECCPICQTDCRYNGIVYHHDQMFLKEKCRKCRCMNGEIDCFSPSCPKISCGKFEVVTDSCCPTCSTINRCYFKGEYYNLGEVFRRSRCEMCRCTKAGVRCLHRQCPNVHCAHPILDDNECCPSCSSNCEYENRRYLIGNTFHKNRCETCECTGNGLNCWKQNCGGHALSYPRFTDDFCCPVSTQSCIHNRQIFKHGMMILRNQCYELACYRGKKRRRNLNCPKLHCSSIHQILDNGKCCKRCRDNTCSFLGQTLNLEQLYPIDDCRWKKCTMNGLIDYSEPCENNSKCRCSDNVKICRVKHRRLFLGDTIDILCKTCICTLHGLSCSLKNACPKLSCHDSLHYRPNNECCMRCQRFSRNNFIHPINSYIPVRCRSMKCPILTCQNELRINAVYSNGECCEKCGNECSNIHCPRIKCQNYYYPANGCCGQCRR
ncbi:hypothetical protein SNEBB_001974 [Seison nebaliae]|nr:hypothetical protein SNEBB_001974 [Seison nebaliae]